jgi:hypothetical protein
MRQPLERVCHLPITVCEAHECLRIPGTILTRPLRYPLQKNLVTPLSKPQGCVSSLATSRASSHMCHLCTFCTRPPLSSFYRLHQAICTVFVPLHPAPCTIFVPYCTRPYVPSLYLLHQAPRVSSPSTWCGLPKDPSIICTIPAGPYAPNPWA